MTDVGNLPKMRSVKALENYVLQIQWDSGLVTTVDLSDMIAAGGVFTFLRDEKNLGQAKLGARRRTVEWVEPGQDVVDMDADTLLQMAQDQMFFKRLARALGQQPAP
jgi:hypothetical protein